MPNLYFDNAATSYPKPESVYAAVDQYQRKLGAAVGRGSYRRGNDVQRTVNRCRQLAADILGAESPDRIIWTFNGTDSLNLAIHGLLRAGDHVITTVLEHNSVLRPLNEARQRLGIDVTYLEPNENGLIDPLEVRNAITDKTKLVAVIHASNVTGTLQPIIEIGEEARKKGVLFLVDAAQSAGHVPIDLANLPIDLLASPGHKGLLGPLGTGLLYIRPGVEEQLASIRQGGTGTSSELDSQPTSLPDKYESGNHNAPGLVGLCAGLEYLAEQGIENLAREEQENLDLLLSELSRMSGVTLYGLPESTGRVGVVSLNIEGFAPHDLALILDDTFDIQTRAGLHCAPGVHRWLETFEQGGTVRFSGGPFTARSDVELLIQAIRELSGVD